MSVSSLSAQSGEKNPDLAQPSPKLSIPVIPREFLVRPRLLWLFGAALSHKVILVTAPAGYGKTVFLSQALTHVDHPIAWLSLDKRDNDLVRFWAGFIMALRKVQPSLGEHALAGLRFQKPSIESALTGLVNEIAETVPNLILVLDDYNEINVQAVHDSVAFLIDYLPFQVRLFISSRGDPPLPLIRLRGRGHLAEIKATDLQFTREETYLFLNKVMGLALSKEQVDSLHDRTEGWIAGLQMAAVSLQGRRDAAEYVPAFKGTNKEIMEYLTKEVLEQQEENIRTFLLETCILERLTESLCNAVTGRHDSQRILEKLVAAHLFLQPLDEESRWFRYHQIFSDLLYRQLCATQPHMLPALHSRASKWFESQGLTEDAIEHALEAEEFDRAVDLIQQIAYAVVWQDKRDVFRQWVARLPEGFLTKDLRLCIAGALACELCRQSEQEESYLRFARSTSEALEIAAQLASLDAVKTIGLFTIIKAGHDYHNRDISQAIKLAFEGLKSLPEDEAMARCVFNGFLGLMYWTKGELAASYGYFEECVRLSKLTGYPHATIQAAAQVAHIRLARGHLRSAAETCREAIKLAIADDGKESNGSCYAHLLLGEILYQWNSLDESREHIMRAIRLSEQSSEPVINLNGLIALARIEIARGKSDAAIEIARQAKMTHEDVAGRRSLVDVLMTRLWLMLGNVPAASDYAHIWSEFLSITSGDIAQVNPSPYLIEHGIYGSDIRDVWTETPLLTFLRLRLSQHKLDGMLNLLEYVCQDAETKGWENILVEGLILKALVLHAEGKPAHALKTLKNVLALTETENYVRVFVDEGMPMFQLLQRAASRGIAVPYVSKLLGAFNMPASDNPDQSSQSKTKDHASLQRAPAADYMAQPLTEREIEVLELIAAGLSNRDIAHELFISLYTVKNHLHNIYQKLDVDGRARANIRAQETGLLKHNSPKVR